MSRLKKYHLPHDGYKWRSDGRDKKWPQTTKIYYKCISVEGCSAKLHFFPHTKEIQYVGEHNHPKAGGTGEEEEEEAVAPASPATATVVTVAACAAVIPPEVYQRPVRQSTRRQRSCVDAMSYLDDESDDREDEEEEEEEYDDEEAYVPHNYHSTSTSPASSDVESSPARSRAGSIVARPRARPDQQQLVNIEEDVAIFLGAMQSEQKKEVSPTAVSRKRKANDESSPYMSEADDDDGGPPNTDNKCPHCGKVFQNRSTFVHHWRVVVQREQQRDCPICHEIISTWYNMKRHLGNVHKWSTQQIENERSRITSPASPQLAEPQHLQVPPHQPQVQQRRKKVKSEEASPNLVGTSPQLQPQPQPQLQPLKQQPAAQWPERSATAVEVKMEVVSAEEEEENDEEGADGDETTKPSSIRSRRARKAAAAAARNCGSCGDGDGAGGRVESMLERLMALYEQDRAGRCGGEAEVREQQLRHQQHQQQQVQLQMKEQELRLREERVEMRERELEQRERDQLARLHLREEAMLLRERELELVIRERTLALALTSAATPAQQ